MRCEEKDMMSSQKYLIHHPKKTNQTTIHKFIEFLTSNPEYSVTSRKSVIKRTKFSAISIVLT